MSKKMFINADHPEECRAVVLDDGKLEEFIVEHSTQQRIKGNVYQGLISRVEPAIEAAFVDIGGKKFGFLPFKDVRSESYMPTLEKKAKVRIQDVLVKGQKILVQVVKEGRDAKGPTMTNSITIPGRFLVLMIGSSGGGVSRKIEDESERKKLKEIVSGFDLPENVGIIIRTAGMGRTKLELQKDLQMLLKIWETIQDKTSNSKQESPFIIYQVPGMVVRTIRDHYTADTSEIMVDTLSAYKELRTFLKLVMPRMQSRVKLHGNGKPLFSLYDIENQIETIYKRRVNLPSGGSLVLDSGEALVSIDVNSGKTTSASELEETALTTNLEAADEIGRQLRLRDLGGLIVIDFIDMGQKNNKGMIERKLKQACKKDKARINLSKISKFGLLEMSRQRLSPPVDEGQFHRCDYCDGTGLVKLESALVLSVLRRIQEMISGGNIKTLNVEVDSRVVNYLLNNKIIYLSDLEKKQGVKILFNGKIGLRPEDYTYTIVESRDEIAPEIKSKNTRNRSGVNKGVSEIIKNEINKEKEGEISYSEDEKLLKKKQARRGQEGTRRKYNKKIISSKRSSNIKGKGRRMDSSRNPTPVGPSKGTKPEKVKDMDDPIVLSSVIPDGS